jgi:hypothetical protein
MYHKDTRVVCELLGALGGIVACACQSGSQLNEGQREVGREAFSAYRSGVKCGQEVYCRSQPR